jgi:hypothetical protein
MLRREKRPELGVWKSLLLITQVISLSASQLPCLLNEGSEHHIEAFSSSGILSPSEVNTISIPLARFANSCALPLGGIRCHCPAFRGLAWFHAKATDFYLKVKVCTSVFRKFVPVRWELSSIGKDTKERRQGHFYVVLQTSTSELNYAGCSRVLFAHLLNTA